VIVNSNARSSEPSRVQLPQAAVGDAGVSAVPNSVHATPVAATPSSTAVPAPAAVQPEKEELLPRYKRDLIQKMKAFRIEIQTLQPQSGHCRLEVSRAEIFEVSAVRPCSKLQNCK
jgi:hypothetical protein